MGQAGSYNPPISDDIQGYEDPTKLWESLKVRTTVKSMTLVDVKQTPKPPEGHVRFVCISDTHHLHDGFKEGAVPDGDVLLHAGDFTNVGGAQDVKDFNDWLKKLPHKHKIVIAGNHDLTFDEANYDALHKRFTGRAQKLDCKKVKASLQAETCTYLEDQGVTLYGYRIWGSPWQPAFCDWAFNLERGEEIDAIWKKIPDEIDILMTHGPPIGHGDLCKSNQRAGCVHLLWHIQNRIKPMYHIFGHIHEGYGVTTDGKTTYVNASSCNYYYDKRNLQPPIVFDLPIKAGSNADSKIEQLKTAEKKSGGGGGDKKDSTSTDSKDVKDSSNKLYVYEDDKCVAMKEAFVPAAPKHFIIESKGKIPELSKVEESQEALIGHMMLVAKKVALQEGMDPGFRIVINDGKNGNTQQDTLQIHVIGGRGLKWPPG